jgi:hypothetical protein
MGLLDAFNDPQQQGLLAAAAQIMQASGPSTTPHSLGQIMGGGLSAFLQARDAAQQQEQARMLNGLRIQGLQGELTDKEKARKDAEAAQEWMRNFYKQKAIPMPAPQSADSMFRAGMNDSPQPMAAEPAATPAQGQSDPFSQRMAMAQQMRASGMPALMTQADKLEEQALKFRPEFSTDFRQAVGADGKLHNYLISKDGTIKDTSLGAKPDMHEISLGDKKLFRDLNTVQNGESFQMGYSPGDLVTMRGQNFTNARAADANNIAAGQKVISTSSGLRQEFDALPEVKNYKQALPAYTSIKDAVTRSTPQSDINIVYGIAKLYDPNSVVREGEYATVANSPNIPDRIKGYAQYLSGGGKLTDKVKQELLAEATGRMKSYEDPFLSARQNYSTISQNSGANPNLLFPSQYQSPIQQGAVRKYNPATGRIE